MDAFQRCNIEMYQHEHARAYSTYVQHPPLHRGPERLISSSSTLKKQSGKLPAPRQVRGTRRSRWHLYIYDNATGLQACVKDAAPRADLSPRPKDLLCACPSVDGVCLPGEAGRVSSRKNRKEAEWTEMPRPPEPPPYYIASQQRGPQDGF